MDLEMNSRPSWPEGAIRDEVWKTHQQSLSGLFDLITVVGQAVHSLKAGWQPRSVQKIVVLYLFVRAFKTAQAIYVLFLNGFGQDAQSLLRGLTEGVIDLLYILQKPGLS